MVSRVNRLYEFGPFRLDTAERVLLRDAQTVPLTPKAFDTLVVLVQNNGHVLEKEELLKAVWPDTFVEEATLAQNIFTLRKALGKEPAYIETIPKRGYRFTANVRESTNARVGSTSDALRPATLTEMIEDEAGSVAAVTQTNGGHSLDDADAGGGNGTNAAINPAWRARPPFDAQWQRRRAWLGGDPRPCPLDVEPSTWSHRIAERRRRLILALAIAAAVAGLAFGLFQFFSRKPPATVAAPPFQSMEIARLPITDRAIDVALAPSGKYVVYCEDDGTQSSVWVKQAATPGAAQSVVPATAGNMGGAVFSPDEEYIYYIHYSSWTNGGQPSLYRVPAFGGTPRKIITGVNCPVTFSPDGRHMAFTRYDNAKSAFLLLVASADGSDEHTIASRGELEWLMWPAWSPDGKTIACVTGSKKAGSPSSTIVGFDVSTSAERQLAAQHWYEVDQLAWLGDADTLIISAAEQELSPVQIWRVTVASGDVQRVTNDLNSYARASPTANGKALVTMQTDRIANIWTATHADDRDLRQITSSVGKFDGYYGVVWTPDGRVVYTSIASGAWDIWMMDADGGNPKQLTAGVRSNYGPSVSPDGRYVVFISNRGGGPFNVWRMDIDGGNPKQLTFGDGENFAHVTADGRWVVYSVLGFDEPSAIWKVPMDGGEPVRLTNEPASWPFVSPDGKQVACTYHAAPGAPLKLAIISIDGGAPLKIFDLPPTFQFNTVWSPDGRGIAYLDRRSGVANVWMLMIGDGSVVPVTDFKTNGVSAYDWSRTKGLVCSRSVETTSVVLIKNLR